MGGCQGGGHWGGWWQGRGLQGDPISPHKPPCSIVNELAFTAHKMMAPEAQSSSLVRYCSPPPGGDPILGAVPSAPLRVPIPTGSPSLAHSWVFADKEMLLQGALEVATAIAAQSPVAVQGTKVNLLCSWDHPVPKSLCYVVSSPLPSYRDPWPQKVTLPPSSSLFPLSDCDDFPVSVLLPSLCPSLSLSVVV